MSLLCANAALVQAGIGLTTLKADLLKVFEPRAATPEVRLSQAKRLIEAGVPTRIRIDPILPGLMDDVQSLEELFEAIANIGVKHIAVSTAFLRPGVIQTLKKHVRDKRALDILLSYYECGPTLIMHGAGTSVKVPPAKLRRQIYSRVKQIAQQHGIVASICACKNGDLATGSCHIAGAWSPKPEAPRQRFLFDGVERTMEDDLEKGPAAAVGNPGS